MNMDGRAQSSTDGVVVDWDPQRTLPRVSQRDIDSSRGFLRCQPNQWFPGLAVQWLTLAQSLGLEIKLVGVTPSLQSPTPNSHIYAAKIAGHDIGLAAEEDSYLLISNAVVPGGLPVGQDILQEYLAKRFLVSLVLSWAGPELSGFSFVGTKDPSDLEIGGLVTLAITINGLPASFSVVLSPALIEMLDGMWRRQMRSTFVEKKAIQGMDIDIAHLAVSPTSLSEYASPGTIVDLETPAGDSVIVRLSSGELLSGKLRVFGDQFVLQIGVGSPPPLNQPDGTSRVAVRLGSVKIPTGLELSELLQPGSTIPTGISVSNVAALIVGSERIGRVKLGVYEQRFAMTVL